MRPVHRTLAVLAIATAALAAFAGTPAPALSDDEVSALQLAEWVRARQPGLLVLDTRPEADFAEGALPGARMAASAEGRFDTVVLYGDAELHTVPPLRVQADQVLRLRGGFAAWNAQVLFPAVRADATEERKREFAEHARLSRYFGGSPRVLDPGAQAPQTRSRRGC